MKPRRFSALLLWSISLSWPRAAPSPLTLPPSPWPHPRTVQAPAGIRSDRGRGRPAPAPTPRRQTEHFRVCSRVSRGLSGGGAATPGSDATWVPASPATTRRAQQWIYRDNHRREQRLLPRVRTSTKLAVSVRGPRSGQRGLPARTTRGAARPQQQVKDVCQAPPTARLGRPGCGARLTSATSPTTTP